MSYRIAVIPGDGVGNDVALEAVKVLNASAELYGFEVEMESFDWSCDYYLKTGKMMPDDGLDTLREFDAIFLGSFGDSNKAPDDVSGEALVRIRKGFDQYINLRPIKLYPGVPTPLVTATPETVDMVVIRENTEGEYSRVGGFFKRGTPDGVALQTAVFTYKGCERVVRYAFETARARGKIRESGAAGRVTSCTKSNQLNYSMIFWDEVFDQVATNYPDVQTEKAMVDAITMWFVKNPQNFDVVVASNLFGDIITDLGAILQGGMGLAAGGNINPERTYPSMFEPIHGSAPKYAGRSIVNPIASIEAIRLMLEHLGEADAAARVGAAVAGVLASGEHRTRDLGGTASTDEVGAAVVEAMRARVHE